MKKKERVNIIVINSLSLLVFSLLFIASYKNLIPGTIDNLIYQNTSYFQTSYFNKLAESIGTFLHPGVLLFFAVLAFFFFFIKKDRLHGSVFLFSTIFGIVSGLAVKEILGTVRPIGIIAETGFSFPSIHATATATFFVSALIALRDYMKDGAVENILTGLGIIVLVLVGLSRTYLQVHWFSDILAGFALGVFWATFFVIIYHFDFKFKYGKNS